VSSKTIDLNVDPPPDLVIEIDISHPSDIKIPIYAALAVPELWIASEDAVRIYCLTGEQYISSAKSQALPLLTTQQLGNCLKQLESSDANTIIRNLRQWVKHHMKGT
jgi:Uma2 family endonuclease